MIYPSCERRWSKKKPDIVFNLLEEFHSVPHYDQHIVSYLELMQQPYTGCNPRGLTLSHDKILCKKILTYHRIPTPQFSFFPKRQKNSRPETTQVSLDGEILHR